MDTQSRIPAALDQALPPSFAEDCRHAVWKTFQFNFNAAPDLPPWGEITQVRDKRLRFSLTDHVLGYHLAADDSVPDGNTVEIADPIHVLLLSTTNSAHSMSELMSFILFYRSQGAELRIGINEYILKRLPYLYQFLRLCIPADRLVLLRTECEYRLHRAWLRRNTHMNLVNDFDSISFQRVDELLIFRDLISMREKFIDNPAPFLATVKHVADAYSLTHEMPERVMLVKTAADQGATTPGRAMEISPSIKRRAEAAGIAVRSIGDFSGIDEYLATIYSAKVFITSYGGAACTNRFFCRTDSRVILLANNHYKWEYEYPSDGGPYWHIRHSHLFPVSEQFVLLDHNDVMTEEDMERVLRLAEQ